MVDALSGDGLSFEKLEMKMTKDHQVLTLNELYAIGPSVSILMDGYKVKNWISEFERHNGSCQNIK